MIIYLRTFLPKYFNFNLNLKLFIPVIKFLNMLLLMIIKAIKSLYFFINIKLFF